MGDAEVKIRVGARLKAAAEYVAVSSVERGLSPDRVICADVGCDHGYLSIYLVEKGICGKVYATDINEKPVSIAKRNIIARDNKGLGLSEKIEVRLCDGLDGLARLGITHVVICGMGGEVISGIIDRARSFKNVDSEFILQPMSAEYELRQWLCENGFYIRDEKLLKDSGRIYTVMSVVYTGEKYRYSPCELILGRKNIQKGGEYLPELCSRKLVHAKNLLKQKECAEADKKLYNELLELYTRLCQGGENKNDDDKRN